MSFKRNFLNNGLATGIQKVLRVSDQLLLVPFFISAWGAAYYGEWLTLTIIPTVIGLSDFGFGTAAANSIILRYAADDKQGASNMAASGFRMINFVVLGCISISVLIMLVLNYFNIFEKSLIQSDDAIIAVSLLMGARILGFYNQLYQAYFKAVRKAALGINLMNVLTALNLIGGIIVLLLGEGIVVYALTLFIISIIFLLFFGIIANKTLHIRKEYKGQVNTRDVKLLTNKGFGYLLSTLWQAIFFQGTTFVVRITLGPIAVTIFNTVRTFIRSVNQANGMIIGSTIPELQFELGADNLEKARRIFRFSLLAIFLISILGMVFLYFGGPWLYELWTRKALNPPVMMWNIFILGVLFNGLWWMSGDVLIASNRPYEFTIPAMITSVVAVISSYFLAKAYGLTGAAIGSSILDLLLVLYILPVSCKLIGQPIENLLLDAFRDCQDFYSNHIRPIINSKIKTNEN